MLGMITAGPEMLGLNPMALTGSTQPNNSALVRLGLGSSPAPILSTQWQQVQQIQQTQLVLAELLVLLFGLFMARQGSNSDPGSSQGGGSGGAEALGNAEGGRSRGSGGGGGGGGAGGGRVGGGSSGSGVSAMPAADGPATAGKGGFVNPLDGKLNVSSNFGGRTSPTSGKADNHTGIDLPKPSGTPIRAAKGGVVVVSRSDSGGYGNWVEIKHDDGTRTRYAHMSQRGVQQGSRVQQGQVIGKVGSTGNSTGPHLHFEYRDAQGRAQDPRSILKV